MTHTLLSRPVLTKQVVGLAILALLPLTGCSDDEQELRVLAAASLTGTFEQFEAAFERTHEGVDVKLSFGSSTTLAQQANDRAPGDVLATADRSAMDLAADGGSIDGEPEQFATNALVLVVPADNPAGIDDFADFAETDWLRCDDDVPCGRLTTSLLERIGVTEEPVSRELDVKAVLAKVASGEADAGFVYATDAVAAGEAVQVFEVPGAAELVNSYFIARLEQAQDSGLAQEWLELVASEEGRRILTDAGFGQP